MPVLALRDSVDPDSEQSGLPHPRTGGMGAASAVNLGSTETEEEHRAVVTPFLRHGGALCQPGFLGD